ncbi:MAG: protein kinase domain-containing protein, partial [Planctomycetota bacterium]
RDNTKAALRIQDPLASRNHFEIRAEGDGFVINDMGSRNGTLLNDKKLESEQALALGDQIQVGDTILSFLSDKKEESAGGLIGKEIGGYRIIQRLGRGGMGTVYEAEQLSLHRVVALKVLSARLISDPTFVTQFVSEARAAGQMNHPNIVQVFDVGSDRGLHFFSMELMQTESVGDLIAREGPVGWERALEMMTDAAAGLIFAEKNGVIHRDIKPDNLMLTPEGTVKIGDLGLAKKAEDLAGEGGAIFGTPHFIAPEQAQGKPVDARADLYALGATFYRILSGQTPFSGENVKEILVKQVNEQPRPIQELVGDLPDEMAAILGKLMQKNPDDRYRSAQGLFEDLERVRIRYHLEAHGIGAGARRSKIIAAVSVVAVIALAGVTWHFANKDPQTVIIDNTKTDNGNNNTIVEPVGPTPEQQAETAFGPIENARLQLQLSSKGEPRETWKTHGDDWKKIAVRFDELAQNFPDTPKGREAAQVSKGILADLKAGEDAEIAAQTAADNEWNALMAAVEALRDTGKIGEALVKLDGEAEGLLEEHGAFLGPEERSRATDLGASLLTSGEGAVKAAVANLMAKAGMFPATEYVGARDAVLQRRRRTVPESPRRTHRGSRGSRPRQGRLLPHLHRHHPVLGCHRRRQRLLALLRLPLKGGHRGMEEARGNPADGPVPTARHGEDRAVRTVPATLRLGRRPGEEPQDAQPELPGLRPPGQDPDPGQPPL